MSGVPLSRMRSPFQLGELHRRSRFDLIQNRFKPRIIRLGALITNGAPQAIQIVHAQGSVQKGDLHIVESVQYPAGPANGAAATFERAAYVLQRQQGVQVGHRTDAGGPRELGGPRGLAQAGEPEALAAARGPRLLGSSR
jgi:hypothetical protein